MKKFIITVDTEGDYIWHTVNRSYGIRHINTENANYIERFQETCNKYGFFPTYLVNYEMALAEPFVSLAREWVKKGLCEIGMHLHAWNTPPIFELPYRRKSHNPYAGDYPSDVLFEKMKYMTDLLERQFHVRPVSHRGGRWYLDGDVVKFLISLGYVVDCSITSGISWDEHIGYKVYGRDYRQFENRPFCICNEKYKLLEVPPTIVVRRENKSIWSRLLEGNVMHKNYTSAWLRPNGHNLRDMLRVVEEMKNNDYLEFMIHSSELMPGGSPTFPNKCSIEKMYNDIESLFETIKKDYSGVTLSDYAKSKSNEIDLLAQYTL